MVDPIVAVVIPCLNEENYLLNTCQTLGFTKESSPIKDTFLFIVDNNSTDNTLKIAYQIGEASPQKTVFVGQELERGYIPPRHKGNLMVADFAKQKGINFNDVFILQADADTQYSSDYIKQMRATLKAAGEGVIVEGISKYPTEFKDKFHRFIEFTNQVDSAFYPLFADEELDIIVDDKMVGYRLSDYFEWGGFKREYINNDEIYAETTRLFMRAKVKSSKRFRAENAIGRHSMRKTLSDPLLAFATAGFPREKTWISRWKKTNPEVMTVDEIIVDRENVHLQNAIRTRLLHLLGLFVILPLHIATTLKTNFELNRFRESIINLLPTRKAKDLSEFPGSFITDVFNLIEHDGPRLLENARSFSKQQ